MRSRGTNRGGRTGGWGGRDTFALVFRLMVIPLVGLDFTSSINSVQTPVICSAPIMVATTAAAAAAAVPCDIGYS